jgi:hypothetical protein
MSKKSAKEPVRRGRGRPRKYEEGGTHGFVFRIPVDLYERVEKLADLPEVSLNDVLALAVREWLATEPRPTKYRVRERLTSRP